MTEFGKTEKTKQFSFVFWNIRFSQFQNRTMVGAKREDLRISVHLMHGKGVTDINEPR
jgi:hypothetical protein